MSEPIRTIEGTTLAECEAQLFPGERIVHTDGSRVTGHVVCRVALPEALAAIWERLSASQRADALETIAEPGGGPAWDCDECPNWVVLEEAEADRPGLCGRCLEREDSRRGMRR